MVKLIVEIPMPDAGSAEELTKYIEDNKKDFFPVGGNFISVDKVELKTDPTDNGSYLFKLLGVIDNEEASK